jgi:hypothetical protein
MFARLNNQTKATVILLFYIALVKVPKLLVYVSYLSSSRFSTIDPIMSE